MTLPRFYFPSALQPHSQFRVPSDLEHYLTRVLRLNAGAQVVVFDGHGGQYPARLISQNKQSWIETSEHQPIETELKGDITLVQGLPSGDKMDWIIEKATELGATQIVPIQARYSISKLSGNRLEKRYQHWQRIAQAASAQCGRNQLIKLAPLQTLEDYLKSTKSDHLLLFCHPEATQAISEPLKNSNAQSITLFVGPEGGWAEHEVAAALKHQVHAVQFGQRVFRTETAGLALIAACTALLNWY